jgi:hypothetical protein
MEIPNSLLEKYTLATKTKATERGELMKEIMDNLNVSRKGKFALLTLPRMGKLLEGIPTDALYPLISKCKDAGNRSNNYSASYSKTFYWEIRPHDK